MIRVTIEKYSERNEATCSPEKVFSFEYTDDQGKYLFNNQIIDLARRAERALVDGKTFKDRFHDPEVQIDLYSVIL